MKRRIKIFERCDSQDLEEDINNWLEQNPDVNIVDVRYTSIMNNCSVIIFYTKFN